MTPARRAVIFAAIGGAAAAAGYGFHRWRGTTAASSTTDSSIAEILASRLTALDGKEQSPGDFLGRVLVINYWATWCGPCREEIPIFVKLQREYGDQGLQFIGIAIDQADQVRRFAAEFQINYPLLLGGMGSIDLSRRAGNKAGVLPYTLVVDRSGRLVSGLAGGISAASLRAQLTPLM